MGWLILWFVLGLGTQVWLSFRVGRSSVALAIVTFFVGFPGAIYTLRKQRGDAHTTVTVPFVINLAFCVLFFASVWHTLLPRLEALDRQTPPDETVLVGSAASAATAAPLRASAATLAAALPSAASAIEPPKAAPGPDEIDAFSAALRGVGLTHAVTRVAASASLPAGVTEAAQLSVKSLGLSAAAASAASAAAANELSATVFKCESAAACRNLAGAYLQQGGPEKRRVLQNGLLMLSLPLAPPGDADLTPAAVASAFRKL